MGKKISLRIIQHIILLKQSNLLEFTPASANKTHSLTSHPYKMQKRAAGGNESGSICGG